MPNIAIVGATGLVGRMFLKVLEERNIAIDNLALYASARSEGVEIEFRGQKHVVKELTDDAFIGMNYALFGAEADIAKRYAPIAAAGGCVVIDNSSYWRMDITVPLVVPEVNPSDAFLHKGIIANPNCSTIQAVVALKPLHDKYNIKRIVYSTYQAVSGAGTNGIADLKGTAAGEPPKHFPYPIAFNCIPHIDTFRDDGYTKEEIKMINETRKILNAPELRITATTVRVPVFAGHSESINVEFEKPYDLDELIDTLSAAPGIILQNDFMHNEYPMPINAEGKDEVYVGRIRRDYSLDSGINLWVVSDNTRKGAASNAIDIMELIMKNKR